jgi:hypothetical protein
MGTLDPLAAAAAACRGVARSAPGRWLLPYAAAAAAGSAISHVDCRCRRYCCEGSSTACQHKVPQARQATNWQQQPRARHIVAL